MATGDTRESKDIVPGTKVACITCFDEKIEGEVLAYDYNSKFIVIKSPSTAKGSTDGNCDVKMLNISYLKDMCITEAATKPLAPLPPLDITKIDRRVHAARAGKQQAVEKIGVGVSSKAQKLFDTINKTFNEVKWRGQSIVVMDEVTVRHPYRVDDCSCSGPSNKALEHIKKIVKKFHEGDSSAVGK